MDTSPMATLPVNQREYRVKELQYPPGNKLATFFINTFFFIGNEVIMSKLPFRFVNVISS